MTKTYLLIIAVIFFSFNENITAQSHFKNKDTLSKVSFAPPLTIPLILAGNFGELRSNHFHTGLDFKTLGGIGYDVLSAEDGYLSEIKISNTGYGNALIITHNNGYSTLYAHLNEFSKEIKAILLSHQRKEKRTYGDFIIDSSELKITKNQIIAYSGNTGSSTAPHLHFEVRKTNTNKAINPLLFQFEISDTIPPSLYTVKFYPESDNSSINNFKIDVKKRTKFLSQGNYELDTYKNTIKTKGPFSISLYSIDRLNDAFNKCGVFRIEFYVDYNLVFGQEINEIDFNESRYINAYQDYHEYAHGKKSYHRLHKLKNNPLSLYLNYNNGVLNFNDNNTHDIKIVATDIHGNESILRFKIKNEILDKSGEQKVNTKENCLQDFSLVEEDFDLKIDKNTFYSDYKIKHELIEITTENTFSKIINLKNYNPLHKYITLSINLKDTLPKLIPKDKYYIAQYYKKGFYNVNGSNFNDGKISVKIRKFGKYIIVADTTNPTISPYNFYQNKKITRQSTLKVSVSDTWSGVRKINAYLNGTWIPFYKNKRHGYYSYSIEKELLLKENTLTIEAIDERKNKTIKTYKLYN